MSFTIYNARTGEVLASDAAKDAKPPKLKPGEAIVLGEARKAGEVAPVAKVEADRVRIARLERELRAQGETIAAMQVQINELRNPPRAIGPR